tara:strand:+ start:203 stop:493 length:291 start_codon:yes stop_codon:yes gene_type:complete
MTIDWEKQRIVTSFSILDETEEKMVVSLQGGHFNDCVVEYTNIDMMFEENISVDFSYDIGTQREDFTVPEESEEMQVFLTNILMSAINERLDEATN